MTAKLQQIHIYTRDHSSLVILDSYCLELYVISARLSPLLTTQYQHLAPFLRRFLLSTLVNLTVTQNTYVLDKEFLHSYSLQRHIVFIIREGVPPCQLLWFITKELDRRDHSINTLPFSLIRCVLCKQQLYYHHQTV